MNTPGSPCPICRQPRTGLMFVDGERDGVPFGEVWALCDTCESSGRPYQDHPFGVAFRKARISQRVSLAEAADRLGVTPVYVSETESGRREPPQTFAALSGWAWAINLTPEELHARVERQSVRLDEEGMPNATHCE